jgi:integrase
MLGLRRGELLALSWDDLDLDAGTVTIQASLSQIKGLVFLYIVEDGRVHTERLNLPANVAFRKQKAQQAAERLLLGETYTVDATSPVFTDELGRRLTPKAATNAFARLAKKAGVTTTSLHSARHTMATIHIPESRGHGDRLEDARTLGPNHDARHLRASRRGR